MVTKIRRSSMKRGFRKFNSKQPLRTLGDINTYLSSRIDFQRVKNSYPVLEVKDGIATNIDYTNPQHLKWLED